MAPRTMYDGVNVEAIPEDAAAVLLYVDGAVSRNWAAGLARFPHARHVSITVEGSHAAEFADVETGDLTPEMGAAWLRHQIQAKIWRPGLYGSKSTWAAIEPLISDIPRGKYRKFLANPDRKRWGITRGFDAEQYLWSPGFDMSALASDFFPEARHHLAPAHVHELKPHPKVVASTLGGSLGVAVMAILHSAHVHVTPAESSAITTALAAVGGWITPSRPSR